MPLDTIPEPTIEQAFAAMWRAAARHIRAQLQGAANAWHYCRLELPIWEHLSIRLGNQLFFIRLEDVDGVVNERRYLGPFWDAMRHA